MNTLNERTTGMLAYKDERTAYRLFKAEGFETFTKPSGASKGFPDFGLRTCINDQVVDVHVEYKQDRYAQMGSMRDWAFDGERFSTRSPDDIKDLMISTMQSSPACVTGAKQMLNRFQKYCSKDITAINGGMLSVINNLHDRRTKLEYFARQCDSYAIARISSDKLGQALIDYYRNKFTPNADANTSLLVLMMGNHMYLVDRKGRKMKASVAEELYDMLGVDDLPIIAPPVAQLEVRIQPWGLTNGKAVRVDTMASFRIKQIDPGAVCTLA